MTDKLLKTPFISRRAVLSGASALAVAGSAAALYPSLSFAQAEPSGEKVNIGWTGTGICLISIPSALEKGFFKKHGVNAEIVKYGSNFAAGIESIASSKIDVFPNFLLQYLKPLEQGVPVKFTGALHGGCIRVLAKTGSAQVDYATLKGKAIAVRAIDSPGKQFLSVELYKAGINPQNEVEWKVYPTDVMGEAFAKGEVDAAVDADPAIYVVLKNSKGGLTEIGGLQTGKYRDLACCAIGVRDDFVENRRGDTIAVTRALLEAALWVHENPDEAAEVFTAYSPIDREVLAEMIRSHTHDVQKGGIPGLLNFLASYAEDLKTVGIIRSRTDTQALAEKVTIDILS